MVVALDGYLTGLRQVAVDADERVESMYVVGLRQRLVAARMRRLHLRQCRQTGGTAVPRPFVVLAEPLPRLQLMAHNAQQVVAVQLAVLPFHHKGHIVVGLDGSQCLRVFHSLGSIVPARAFPVVGQLMVLLVYHGEHRVVDGLQCHVGSLLLLSFQAVDGRLQRVGSHLRLQTGVQQGSLEQLTVGTLTGGLLLQLFQIAYGSLRQVFLLRRLHLFPQNLIALTE